MRLIEAFTEISEFDLTFGALICTLVLSWIGPHACKRLCTSSTFEPVDWTSWNLIWTLC
jgi:hypothetical protein